MRRTSTCWTNGLANDESGMASALGGSVPVPGLGNVPVILLLLAVGVILFVVFGGWILIAFTTKTLITVVLIGAGIVLLVKPIRGLGETARIAVPLFLLLLGMAFYVGIPQAIVSAFGG